MVDVEPGAPPVTTESGLRAPSGESSWSVGSDVRAHGTVERIEDVRRAGSRSGSRLRGPSPNEVRRAMGKELRRSLPRRRHAELRAEDYPGDVVDLLAAKDKERIPDLVALRYARMLADPFAFLRGAAEVMAADLARTPNTGITVQLCGDAHLANFGLFATPERRLVFGVNDFDETLPGPWEWDVKRLAASLHVAGRGNGLDEDQCSAAVQASVAMYRQRIGDFAGMAALDVWYSEIDVDALLKVLDRASRKRATRVAARARARDHLQALDKLTETDPSGARHFRLEPPLLVPLSHHDAIAADVETVLEGYRASLPEERRFLVDRYRLVDVALKVVGVGSVGTRCAVALLEGPVGDHIVLQVKEAEASALEAHLGASRFSNHGQRVVVGQRLMQAAPDLLLGWTEAPVIGRDFYVRQLWDMKGGADVESLRASDLAQYAALCGATLARAHARSGDPSRIGGYMGRSRAFDDALVSFAHAYADRTEQHYAALSAAAQTGRIPVPRED